MLAVVIFIVPVFAKAFKEAVADQPGESAALPTLTQFMIGISNFLKGYWFIWFPGMIGLAIGFFQWKKTERGQGAVGPGQAPAPVPHRRHRPEGRGGALVTDLRGGRLLRSARCSQSIKLAGQTSGNYQVEHAMDASTPRCKSGGTLAHPIEEADVFPPMVGPHGLGGRGERPARADADQGRRLLRGRGRLEGEGAHLADRAGDDL